MDDLSVPDNSLKHVYKNSAVFLLVFNDLPTCVSIQHVCPLQCREASQANTWS